LFRQGLFLCLFLFKVLLTSALVVALVTHESAMSLNLVSKELAVVVIFGLIVSTLLTLIVIPTFYELFHFRKAKKQRLQDNQIIGTLNQ
jgi:Cu/Ag efflux pump CusA